MHGYKNHGNDTRPDCSERSDSRLKPRFPRLKLAEARRKADALITGDFTPRSMRVSVANSRKTRH